MRPAQNFVYWRLQYFFTLAHQEVYVFINPAGYGHSPTPDVGTLCPVEA